MDELIIGSHVSFKKEDQLLGSLKEALSYGANTFMFYTGAPQNTNRMAIDDTLTKKALKLMQENGIDIKNVVVHAPYIINLANKENNYDFAIRFLKEEIKRTEALGVKLLVLHPGSHVGKGEDVGLANISEALNHVLEEDMDIIICLETMAGKGSECGKTFNEIKQIIDKVTLSAKVGVCLDTCHIHDGGYDLDDFDKVLDTFDEIIGLDKLYCLHINDSKNARGAHKDRHENIGLGYIGFNNILNVINHPKLKGIPKILETPYISKTDDDKEKIYPPYKFEIAMLREGKFNDKLLEDIRAYYK